MRATLLVALLGAAGVMLWLQSRQSGSSPDERFDDAIVARQRGDLSLVIPTIRSLEGLPEYAAHVEVLQAALELSNGRPDLSLRRMEKLPQGGPLRVAILEIVGESLYRLHHLVDSEAVFRTLAVEDPALASARRWLGAIYFDLGAYDAATVELQRLVELDPNDFRPHRLLGLMYRDFEKHGEAIAHYERALELSPPDDVAAELRVELARSMMAMRRFDDALSTLAEADSSAETQVISARCHWSKGDSDDAYRVLLAARKLDPGIRDGYVLNAEMLAAVDDFEAAIQELQAAVDSHQYDAELRYRLALLLEQVGRTEEAAVEMAKWEEINALSTRLTELNLLAAQDPRNAGIRDEIANLCDALGKPELARVWREAAAACRDGAELFSIDQSTPVG